jgi:hypothetical protein
MHKKLTTSIKIQLHKKKKVLIRKKEKMKYWSEEIKSAKLHYMPEPFLHKKSKCHP